MAGQSVVEGGGVGCAGVASGSGAREHRFPRLLCLVWQSQFLHSNLSVHAEQQELPTESPCNVFANESQSMSVRIPGHAHHPQKKLH